MLLKNVKNIDKLFTVIDSCECAVDLVGADICLNLKSKLAQYFSLATLCSSDEIPELELVTHCDADTQKLMKFMIDGN